MVPMATVRPRATNIFKVHRRDPIGTPAMIMAFDIKKI
jgi:hypothetical protein